MQPFIRETDAEYHGHHARTHYGSSLAKAALTSPRLVADRRANPPKITTAMRLGSAWDALLSYGPILSLPHMVILPEGVTSQSKEGKALIAEAKTTQRPHLTADEAAMLIEARARMPADLRALSDAWVARGHTQLSARTTIGPVPMQMRADAMEFDHPRIVDFKLSGVPLEAWPAHAIKMGYHVQSGWYRMIAKRLTGSDFDFAFLVTESKAPHRTCLFRPDDDWLAFGDSKAEDAYNVLASAIECNRWTDFHDSEKTMTLPAWAQSSGVVIDADGNMDLEDA